MMVAVAGSWKACVPEYLGGDKDRYSLCLRKCHSYKASEASGFSSFSATISYKCLS